MKDMIAIVFLIVLSVGVQFVIYVKEMDRMDEMETGLAMQCSTITGNE